MNKLQKFVRSEKNIRRLIRTIMTDSCAECPAYKFCKNYEQSDDCSDAFVAWALTEVKEHTAGNFIVEALHLKRK